MRALESDAAYCRRARLKHLLQVKGQVKVNIPLEGRSRMLKLDDPPSMQ